MEAELRLDQMRRSATEMRARQDAIHEKMLAMEERLVARMERIDAWKEERRLAMARIDTLSSYERMLASEERKGNVSTGLSKEAVAKSLKQHKYTSMEEEERCCICQKEYVGEEDLGKLDCGHDFHSSCIKQWLAHKNLCLNYKNTVLITK